MTHVSLWQDFFCALTREGVGFTGARVTGASPLITRDRSRALHQDCPPKAAESSGDLIPFLASLVAQHPDARGSAVSRCAAKNPQEWEVAVSYFGGPAVPNRIYGR
jgi:hypothetical protein